MSTGPICAGELKARHRVLRDEQPESLWLRLHRAISWLARSEFHWADSHPDRKSLCVRAALESIARARWQRTLGDPFIASRRMALSAIMEEQTDVVLSVILDRLYVLRNQLVHGGATWNSGTNRTQVKDGAAILGTLLPIILDLMLNSDGVDFDEIA